MEAAAAPNAIKPITRILMFPPLSEPELETSVARQAGSGAEGISGVERLCHRKLSWRRDVLILSYPNVGVRRRDASEKRGLAGLRQSPWGERASGSADKLARRDRHGFPAARTFDAIVLPAERHAPIIGCDQPAVRDGNGLHLAWGPTSCDLHCSAGGRNWPIPAAAAAGQWV